MCLCVWFGCFILSIGCICMWCGVWAWRTKSNRGLGCAWWLDTWWAWNWLSSRRLLMGEESWVWWLHVSGARLGRNCYIPVGYYWARSPWYGDCVHAMVQVEKTWMFYYRWGVCRAGLWAGQTHRVGPQMS